MNFRFRGTPVILIGAAIASSCAAGRLGASEGAKLDREENYSVFNQIWERATLYKSKDNPIIEEFSLMQDLFVQWGYGTSDRGSYDSGDLPSSTRWGDTDVRVWRPGVYLQLVHDFEFHGVIDANADGNPFYRDIYEASLLFAPSDSFNLGFGKQKGRFFTQEYRMSFRELPVFEPSLLVIALVPRGVTGVWIDGRKNNWIYVLAGFAGDFEREFSKFNAGAVIQANLGYDFADATGLDQAILRIDYQRSTSTQNSFGPGKFSDAFSLSTRLQQGRFYEYASVLAGIGSGTQGDVWGIIAAPTWFLIRNKLQAVFRYQYAHGDNDGLKLGRYESLAPDLQVTKAIGSQYNAAYFGLNYYLYDYNFKIMTGVEYNDMTGGPKNFSGWTWLGGVRLSF